MWSTKTNFTGTLAPDNAWIKSFKSANVTTTNGYSESLVGNDLVTRVMYLNSSLVSSGFVNAKIFSMGEIDDTEVQDIFKEKVVGKTWGNIGILYADSYKTIGG